MANPVRKPKDIVAQLDAIAAKDPVSQLSVKRRAAVQPDISWLTKSSPLAPQGQTSNLLAQLDANPYIKKDLPPPPKPGAGASALKHLLMPLQILDTPRRAVISGIREVVDSIDSNPDTKASLSDFLNQTKDFSYGTGKAFPMKGWAGRIVGLVGDVALDPLTWATLGGTILAKGTIKTSGASLAHLIEGGVEKASAEQLAKIGVTKLGPDLYETAARKAIFGVKGSGRAAAKSVIGREGREKLANFVQQRMEWMTQSGLASFTKEEIASSFKNIAAQGKQAVPDIISRELGIRGPGIYYFGSRVKVPGTDIVGKFLERGITKMRLGLVNTSGIEALHAAMTPKGVGDIAYWGENTIRDFRVGLANGTLSDEKAQLARVILNADNARRLGRSTAEADAVTRFNRLGSVYEDVMKPENSPVRHLLDNVDTKDMPAVASKLGISQEHLAMAQDVRKVLDELHGITDAGWQTIVPDHVLGFQSGYLPHNTSELGVKLMDEIKVDPAMAGLLPEDATLLHIVGNFRQRGLKAGEPFFGVILKQEDLTIDNLNQIVNNWLRSNNRPVFDFFKTDMKDILPAYIRGHSSMMSVVDMMNEVKKYPDFVKLVDGHMGISGQYIKQMHQNSAHAFDGVLTAVQNLHRGLRDSLDVLKSQLEVKYGSMESALAALKNPAVSQSDVAELLGHLNTALADAAVKHAEMVRLNGVVSDMLPNTDGFGVYAAHAVQSEKLDSEFVRLGDLGKQLHADPNADPTKVANFFAQVEAHTEAVALHARAQESLMEKSSLLTPLSNLSTIDAPGTGLYAEVLKVARTLGVAQPVVPTKAVHSLEQIDSVVARLADTGSRDFATLSPVVESLRIHLKERFPDMAFKIDETLNDVIKISRRSPERVPTAAEVAALLKASNAAASRASGSPRLAARAAKLATEYQTALDLVKNGITVTSDYTQSLLKLRVLVAQQNTAIEVAHLREVFAYYGVSLGDSISRDIFMKNVSHIPGVHNFGQYFDDAFRVEMEITDLRKIADDLAIRLNERPILGPARPVLKTIPKPEVTYAEAQHQLNILLQSPEYSLAKSANNRTHTLVALSELNGHNIDWTLGGRVEPPKLRAAQNLGGDIPLTIPTPKFWRNLFVQHKDVGQIATAITDWVHTEAVMRIINPEQLSIEGLDKISHEKSLQYFIDYMREQDGLLGKLIAPREEAQRNAKILTDYWGKSGERVLLNKETKLRSIPLAQDMKSASRQVIKDGQTVIADNIKVLEAEKANLTSEAAQVVVDGVYSPTVLDTVFNDLADALGWVRNNYADELKATTAAQDKNFGTQVDAAKNDLVNLGGDGPVDYSSLKKLEGRLGYRAPSFDSAGTTPAEMVSRSVEQELKNAREFGNRVDNIIVNIAIEDKSPEQLRHEIEILRQMRLTKVETPEIKRAGIASMIKAREDALGVVRKTASDDGLPLVYPLRKVPGKTPDVMLDDIKPSIIGSYRRYDDGTKSGRLFWRKEDMSRMSTQARWARAKQLGGQWVEVRTRPLTGAEDLLPLEEKIVKGWFSIDGAPVNGQPTVRWFKNVQYGDEQWLASTSEYGFRHEVANDFGAVLTSADSPDLLGAAPTLPESLTKRVVQDIPMTTTEDKVAALEAELKRIVDSSVSGNVATGKARVSAQQASSKAEQLVVDLQNQFDSVKHLATPVDATQVAQLEARLKEVKDLISNTERTVGWDPRVKTTTRTRVKGADGNYFNQVKANPSGRTAVRTRIAGTSRSAKDYAAGIKTLNEGLDMLRTLGSRGHGFSHLEQIAARQINLEAEYRAALAVLGDTEVEQRLMTGLQNSIFVMEQAGYGQPGQVINKATGLIEGSFPSSNVEKFFPGLSDGWDYLGKKYPGLAASPEFKALFDKAARFDDPEYLRQMQKYVGSYTKFFKAYATMTPGFHVRNGMANAVKLIFMGAEWKNMSEATPLYFAWMKASRQGVLWEDFLLTQPLELRGVLDTARKSMFGSGGGIFTKDFRDATGGSWLWDNALVRFNAKWGQQSDNYSRFVLGYDSAKSGMDVGLAQARVKRAFFDYEDLSQVDEVMRQIVPFWLWTSRNLIFELQNQWLNPKPYAIWASIMRNMRDPNYDPSEYPSKFVKEMGGIKLPFGNNLYFAPDLGFTRTPQQLAELFSPLRYTNNMNPLLKIPLEQFLGKSVFTGKTMDTPQERLVHILKGFAPPVQMGDRLFGSEGDAAKNAWLSTIGSPVRTYQTKEK